MNIRAAAVADAEAIIDLHFAAVHQSAAAFYPPEVLNGWSPQPGKRRYEQIRQALATGEELFVVAQDASGVVGFGSVAVSAEEVHAVYVHPRVGRHGIGSRILIHLEQLALEQGVSQLHLVASLNAEAFYQRAGYEIVERSALRLGSGHEMASVKMTKRLGPRP